MLGMVKLIFFLWEIPQKFFFLAWGFHILTTQKIFSVVVNGLNGSLEAFWPVLEQKKTAIQEQISIEIEVC